IQSTIGVSNVPANQVVATASVNLTIQYPFSGDLILTLIAPDGTRIPLSQNEPFFGAGNGDPTSGFINTTFIDAAATPISAGASPYTGQFKPEVPLGSLKGKAANGTWPLEVNDNFTAIFDSTGTLQNWTLTLTTGTLQAGGTPGNPMDQDANA